MKNFSEFIKESIFDEPSDAKFKKSAISAIKAWVKTIEKTNGRIKFDQENMKVILPSFSSFGISCPIPNPITLEIDGDNSRVYTNVTLKNATDDDIDKVKHLQTDSKCLINSYITYIPQEWSFNDSDIQIFDPNNDIDLSNLSEIGKIYIKSAKKVKIFGIENIKAARSIKFENVTVDGVFNKLDATTINMTNVKCNHDLFKKVKKVTCARCDFGVRLKDCIVDLSNIEYIDRMWLTADDFKSEFLPKKIDELTINGDVDDIDILSGVNSDINTISIYDGIKETTSILSSNILKDKDSINAILSLNKCMRSRGMYSRSASSNKLPIDLLEYFRKKSKEIKISEYNDNHHYMLFSKDLHSMTYLHNSKGCKVYYEGVDNPPAWRSTNKDIYMKAHLDDYIFQLSGISIEVAKLITEKLFI